MKQICMDQLKGFYFILQLYLQMYLVDVVLAPHLPGSGANSNFNNNNNGNGNGNGNSGDSDSDSSTSRRLLKEAIHVGAGILARMLKGDEDDDSDPVPSPP